MPNGRLQWWQTAVQLIRQLAARSHCVHCRYGPDVGEAANDISHAAVEGGMTYFTITRMGVRSVAKRIAKRTAKGLVKNTVSNVRNYHAGGQSAPGTQDVTLH